MDGLLEFAFDSVPSEKLGLLIEWLVGSTPNMINIIHCGADDYLDNSLAINHKFWESICASSDSMAYFLNIDRLKINDSFVRNVSIYVVHYDMTTDITIIISTDDCKAENLITSQEFYLWAEELASTFNIAYFYGGLEPASDEKTQLYSNKGIGLIAKI